MRSKHLQRDFKKKNILGRKSRFTLRSVILWFLYSRFKAKAKDMDVDLWIIYLFVQIQNQPLPVCVERVTERNDNAFHYSAWIWRLWAPNQTADLVLKDPSQLSRDVSITPTDIWFYPAAERYTENIRPCRVNSMNGYKCVMKLCHSYISQLTQNLM